MYFPFFQKEHKVHHHILSAGLFTLLLIHTYLWVDALMAGPTLLEKKGEITKLERQTMSHKELAREARKLIISSRKQGKVLKLTEAINILKTGVSENSGRVTGLMRPTIAKESETNVAFKSAAQTKNTILSRKITQLKISRKITPKTTVPKTNTTPSPTSSTTTTPPSESTQTFSSAPSAPSWGWSSSSSAPATSSSSTTAPASSTNSSTPPTTSTTGGSSSSTPSTTSTWSSSTGSTSTSSGTSTWAVSTLPSTPTVSNTWSSSTGSSSSNSPSTVSTGSSSTGTTVTPPPTPTTSTTPMINITNTENPHLKKLADYQKVVGGFVGNQLMVFLNMPESAANIEGASYYIANTANEFAKFGITPIFVIEPYGDNGQLDLGRIKNGDYVAKLDSLFALLKWARWLTEDKLGLIVPYPEINTPAFNRTNFVPTDLPILVNQYFDVVRKYYPNARWGLLLDGKSYDVNKTWGQGEYKSYAPYVTGIKPGYISTFWVQGFPWVSADGSIKSYDPNVFLPISLAKESANLLSVNKIWFNTGTMKRSYPWSPVNTSAEERQSMVNGIINQWNSLKNQGFDVMIHIFAENKFQMGEWVDWSYIENASDWVLSPHEAVFASFVSQAQTSNLNTGIYDM